MAEKYEPMPIEGRRTLLWSNPHEGWWGTDNIILSSSDYSELEVFFKATNGARDSGNYIKVPKGYNIQLQFLATSNILSDNWIMARHLAWVNNTTFAPTLGRIIRWGTSGSDEPVNYFVIPVKIYGIK